MNYLQTSAGNRRRGSSRLAAAVVAAGLVAFAQASVAHADLGDDSRDCQASAWPPQGDASELPAEANPGNCGGSHIAPPLPPSCATGTIVCIP